MILDFFSQNLAVSNFSNFDSFWRYNYSMTSSKGTTGIMCSLSFSVCTVYSGVVYTARGVTLHNVLVHTLFDHAKIQNNPTI
jgi:hypothetical protein